MTVIANDNNEWMMSTQDKLFQAIELNNFWIAHVMLESGADLKLVNAQGLSPIDYALKLDYKKMAEFLRSKVGEYEARS